MNQKIYTIVNVEDLADLAAGTEVTLDSLLEAGILTTAKSTAESLGVNGEISNALNREGGCF